MAKRSPDAASSIEIFADTCAKLALADQIRAGMLRAAGTGEDGWREAWAAWMKKLRAGTREGRELRARFLRAYAETAEALGAPPFDFGPDDLGAGTAEPRVKEAPTTPPAPAASPVPPAPAWAPVVEVPTFLRPPDPAPESPRAESPWACTVPVDVATVSRRILPFDEAAAPSPLMSASSPKAQPTSSGTGTVPLHDLPRPGAQPEAPTVALSDLVRPAAEPGAPAVALPSPAAAAPAGTVALGDLPLPLPAGPRAAGESADPARPAPSSRGLLPRKK